MIGSYDLGLITRGILTKIVKNKWRDHILSIMNIRAPFDLSGISFRLAVTSSTPREEVDKRLSFYKFQIQVLRKMAQPMQLSEKLVEDSSIMLYPA